MSGTRKNLEQNFGMNQKIIMHFCVSLCLYNFKSCFRIFCMWADWINILFNIYRQWNEYTEHRIGLLYTNKDRYRIIDALHAKVMPYLRFRDWAYKVLEYFSTFDSDLSISNSLKMQCAQLIIYNLHILQFPNSDKNDLTM